MLLADKLGQLLPLDPESLQQAVDYAKSLKTPHAAADHFLNLLGESEDAMAFVSEFNREVFPSKHKPSQREKKEQAREKKTVVAAPAWTKPALPSPALPKPALPKPTPLARPASTTTSQLLDTPKELTQQQRAKKAAAKRVADLRDIDAALAELELMDATPEGSNRRCDCMAQRHPLFEPFPNCLSCGKIICTKEGMQPCSFCGAELVLHAERARIIAALHDQRDSLAGPKPAAPAPRGKTKKFKINLGATGQNSGKAHEWLERRVEEYLKDQQRKLAALGSATPADTPSPLPAAQHEASASPVVDARLEEAQTRLTRLLDYQSSGAERTKIVDRAADFEMPGVGDTSMALWALPLERALQLKRQQRALRKVQSATAKRTGRGKRVVDVTIRNGKAVVHEREDEASEDEAEDQEIRELEAEAAQAKRHATESSYVPWDYDKNLRSLPKAEYVGHDAAAGADAPSTAVAPHRVQMEALDDSAWAVEA